MNSLKLQPWPFQKDEPVILHWMGLPYRDESQNWFIKAYFRSGSGEASQLTTLVFPWGTLPVLRIGGTYVNGYLRPRTGFTRQFITVGTDIKHDLCTAFAVPRGLHYFFKDKSFKDEKLWRVWIEGQIYYIPCIELVRSFFTPHRFMANAILKPTGIDSLVREEDLFKNKVRVRLSGEIPGNLFTEAFIQYLLAIKYSPSLRKAWSAIYHTLYDEGIAVSAYGPTEVFKQGVTIEMIPPRDMNLRFGFYATSIEKSIFVQEINGIFGLENLDFDLIQASHPSCKSKIFEPEHKDAKVKVFLKEPSEGEMELDDQNDPVKVSSYPEKSFTRKTQYKLNHNPMVEKVLSGEKIIPTGMPGDQPEKQYFKIPSEDVVGTLDSIWGGAVHPVEFDGLRLLSAPMYEGLREFLSAVQAIKSRHPEVFISWEAYPLPTDKSFSKIDENTRRYCAVVKCHDGNQSCYVFEIARLGQTSITTLFILAPGLLEDTESELLISKVLQGVVDRNGHWDYDLFEAGAGYQFETLYHLPERTESQERLQGRILTKLNDIGLDFNFVNRRSRRTRSFPKRLATTRPE